LPIGPFVVFLVLLLAAPPLPAVAPASPVFRVTSVRNPAVTTAATFAVREAGTRAGTTYALDEVVHAEQRTGDTITYRLCLDVDSGEGIVRARAVVDRGLRWKLTLVSWSLESCPG